MEEIWKDVNGYEYQVSNKGNVRSKDKHQFFWNSVKNCERVLKGRLLKPYKYESGYLIVTLYKNGKPKPILVHRLVAETFIENPLNKKEVNHIDCDKGNNNVSNLEWVTPKENMQHAIKNNLRVVTPEYRHKMSVAQKNRWNKEKIKAQ